MPPGSPLPGMKDIEQAISDELTKQKKQPQDFESLNLDSKCKATHVKVCRSCCKCGQADGAEAGVNGE